MTRILKNLLLLLVSLGLCGLLVWLALPLLMPGPDRYPTYDDLVRYDPARPGGHLLPGRNLLVRSSRPNRPVRWLTNDVGFRADRPFVTPKPENVFRVLLVGDSFIDGMRTDQAETIGAVLEGLLQDAAPPGRRVEVMIGGHNNPANAWYNYQQHGHRFEPDWVILGITLGNDLTWHNFGAHIRPDGDRLESLLVNYSDENPAGIHGAWLTFPPEVYRKLTPIEQLQRGWERFQALLARRGGLFVHRVPPAMGPRENHPGQVYSAGFFISLGLFHRSHQPFFTAMHEDLQSVLYGFDRLARHYRTRFSALLLPVRIQVQSEDWHRLFRVYRLDPGRFDLLQPNRTILEFCDRWNIHCIDPLEHLRSVHQAEGRSLYLPLGDMHLSPEGQAAVAEAVVPEITFQAGPPTAPESDAPAQVRAFQRTPCEICPQILLPQDLVADWPFELSVRESPEQAAALFTSGWSAPDGIVWSVRRRASLRLPVPPGAGSLRLQLNLKPFVRDGHPHQRAVLRVGERRIAEWLLSGDEFAVHAAEIPAEWLGGRLVTLTLDFPDAVSPAELGVGGDVRTLGIAVAGLTVSAVQRSASEDG